MARKKTAAAAAPELEQLAIDIPEAAMKPRVSVVPRAIIHPDPAQPRVDADAELRASIATNGLIQPITVRPHPTLKGEYLLVDGERRWRGSEGILDELPVIIRRDQEDDAQRLVTQLVANTGKPLSPIEEARAFRKVLDAFGGSIEALAQKLGRPRTTVAERLQLLELGPWLPAIEAGRIQISYAVRALLPLRKVADELHAKAIEELGYDADLDPMDGEITFDEFEGQIHDQYKRFMYPLTKSKQDWQPQPLFDTRKHDTECGCGSVAWTFGYGGAERKACCNPTWWGPLDRAAKKAAKAKERDEAGSKGAKKGEPRPRVFAPEGAKTVAAGYNGAPKGVTVLTDENGRWATGNPWDRNAQHFDPADLVIDDTKLVLVKPQYGSPKIGTKDAAAVKRAREMWTQRWAARLEALRVAFRADVDARLKDFAIVGPGLNALLSTLAGLNEYDRQSFKVTSLAEDLGMPIPSHGTREDVRAKWLADLPLIEAELLAAAIAYVNSKGTLAAPHQATAHELGARLEAIAKKASPWTKAPKTGKKAKVTKAVVDANRTPAEDSSVLVCTGCGCTEDDACEGGCYWVSKDPALCSQCQEVPVDYEIVEEEGANA